MAVSSCTVSCSTFCQSFNDGLFYALSQLGMSDLTLKDEQKQTINAVYGGSDVFVFFHVLPFLFNHKLGLVGGQKKKCVIVVSPLISLMVDQVRSLRSNNVEAVVISSNSRENSLVSKEFRATEKNVVDASIIFSSPEALIHSKWREVMENPLMSNRMCALVIDEAHCVSKW